jgi:ATP-binding cassette subfamily B protein
MFAYSLGQLLLPTIMAEMVNVGVAKGDVRLVIEKGGWMMLIAAGSIICVITASILASRVSTAFGMHLRAKLFKHVHRLNFLAYKNVGVNSLITRTTNDISQLQQTLFMLLRIFVMSPLMLIGGLMMAFIHNPPLSVILIVALMVLTTVIYLVAKSGTPLFKKLQAQLDRLNLVVRENLMGIRMIRAYSRTERERIRFEKANEDLINQSILANQLMVILQPAMLLILNLATIAIMWYGAKQIDKSLIQIGELMAFIEYAMQVLLSLTMFSVMFSVLPRSSVSASRMNHVLEMDLEDNDTPSTRRLDLTPHTFEFDEVTFRFPGAERPVVQDLSFRAQTGQITAIIGGTGSGKSTLMELIMQFYEPESGSIKINGQDIRQMPKEELREWIGFVPQKTYLFFGSIADNIRFGKEDASDEEIRKAAEIAQAIDFITSTSEGFASPVAQGGSNFSGGQRQRLAIARALIRKPSIYLFDDPFAALDHQTAAKLYTALRKVAAQSIVFMVSQRVNTVRKADQIIVLDQGRIAGMGTHEELFDSCEVYQEIVTSQLSEEETA